MKIEKIAYGKIKVTLTPSELDVWNITPQTSPDSPQMRSFITSLIKNSYGEDEISASNVLVEARLQGENFVFVITKIEDNFDAVQKEISKSVKRRKLLNGDYKLSCTQSGSHMSQKGYAYFLFDSLEDFSDMLRAGEKDIFNGCILYKSESGFLLKINKNASFYEKISALALEYSKQLNSSAASYIKEYASVFASYDDFDAIMRLYE